MILLQPKPVAATRLDGVPTLWRDVYVLTVSLWPPEQTPSLHFAMPKIEALVFKPRTIGFGEQSGLAHNLYDCTLSESWV